MRVLFTTDGSACSHHAMREAMRLLPLTNAEAWVVSVLDVLPVVQPFELAAPSTASTLLLDQQREATEAELNHAVALLAEGGVRATPIERQGDAATEILAAAEKIGPDLIVMGAHGRNALERLFLGSVSDAVTHRWHGAVLIVKPEA